MWSLLMMNGFVLLRTIYATGARWRKTAPPFVIRRHRKPWCSVGMFQVSPIQTMSKVCTFFWARQHGCLSVVPTNQTFSSRMPLHADGQTTEVTALGAHMRGLFPGKPTDLVVI